MASIVLTKLVLPVLLEASELCISIGYVRNSISRPGRYRVVLFTAGGDDVCCHLSLYFSPIHVTGTFLLIGKLRTSGVAGMLKSRTVDVAGKSISITFRGVKGLENDCCPGLYTCSGLADTGGMWPTRCSLDPVRINPSPGASKEIGS